MYLWGRYPITMRDWHNYSWAKREIKINRTKKEYERKERSKKRKIFEPLISIVSSHRNWFLYRILYLKYGVSRKIVSWKPRYPSPLPSLNIDFPSKPRIENQRIPPPFGREEGNLGTVKPIQIKLGFRSHEISIRVNNSYTVPD